ncbi:MAG: hypothetical protein ABJF11_09140 [Reichenbachiella sp.]|uniref:hypothetical protein n=1 Tax=Reichenbachiella sp. TaxID=2184521 RepID=UPI003267C8B1
MNSPTIVINAYNRPDSLRRLLTSLKMATIPTESNLVFSLEFGAHPEVMTQVKNFEWKYGNKEIIQQEKKLGLIGHFLFCGGLTKKLGDIVYLEDDLFVGKSFYQYSQQVLTQYGDDENLAGFSLNALWFNGYLHMPFHPFDDGNGCFFLQVPWYQGQVYTAKQWSHFEQWYHQKMEMGDDLLIHEMFRNYTLQDDWFPIKTQYLIENKKYYAFPRVAHCVNFGDVGVHFQKTTNFFQTELSMASQLPQLIPFEESLAVYDSFYELIPDRLKRLCPHFEHLDFELDLNGTKELSKIKSDYIISSVRPDEYERSFGLEMRPQELNLVYQIEGEHFYLARRDHYKIDSFKNRRLMSMFNYHYRFKLSKKQKLSFILNKLFKP